MFRSLFRYDVGLRLIKPMPYYAYYGRPSWPFDNSLVTVIFAWEVVLAVVLWAF